MANRRMFSRDIVKSDLFLDLPISAQALYFHLGMDCDDDGLCGNPKMIMRMTGCSIDDLKLLIVKGFVQQFGSGVIVITHWKINNYIRSDRYKETIYRKEKAMLCENDGVYEVDTDGIPMVDQRLTQYRIGKDRLGQSNETRAREPCNGSRLTMDDLADGVHDFEKLWDYTFSCYPRKGGAATAKEEWMKKLVPVLPENRFDVAKLIYQGVKAYLDDYERHHPAEPEDEKYRFVPNFAKWLSEDASYWIKCVEEKEQKQSGG